MYTWAESPDEEIWRNGKYDSIEECVMEARECGCRPGSTIYVGECEDVCIGGIDLSAVLDSVEEDMYEQVGEISEDWDISRITDARRAVYEKYEERLFNLVNDYINEIGEGRGFYQIVGVRPVVIGQQTRKGDMIRS